MKALRSVNPGMKQKAEPPRPGNPFLGLRPYEEADAAKFFGRERDLAIVRDRILSARATLLFAASGVGKTSFLNAKLMPELAGSHLVFCCSKWSGMKPEDCVLTAIRERLRKDSHLPANLRRVMASLDAYFATGNGHGGTVLPESKTATKPVAPTRLSQIMSRMMPKRAVLVLDQFEEVFHSYGWEDEFFHFVDELSAIINDEDLKVRVVFALREEFLGELSVFDNRVPDLFNNYHRLKHPGLDQTRRIVEQTCRAVKATVDPEGLQRLIADLSTVRRGPSSLYGAVEGRSCVKEIQTDFIMPPYLQLVCHQLWEDQQADPAPDHFLANYQTGHAAQVRDNFCDHKLRAFSNNEQELLSKALEYLVTKRGAKIPYEVNSLAEVLKADVSVLLAVLRKLSAPDTRILRESPQQDGTWWFELYHDMYAPFLYAWKEKRRRDEEERVRQNLEELKQWRGVRPDDIAAWEEQVTPLTEFWVYLPGFLAAGDEAIAQKIIDVMANNFQVKDTNYLYIVEKREDVERLYKIVQELRVHPVCRGKNVPGMVRVLILGGSAENGGARALSGLLHLGNCWIANPRGQSPEGYEVAWDEHGTTVVGGRKLPFTKMTRIINNLGTIIQLFQPPTFDGIESLDNLDVLIEQNPGIMIKKRTKAEPIS
jgi:hypothetical protein